MSQSLSLFKIGSKVNIDLGLVKDRIPDNLIQLLNDDPTGTVLEYKMTDGNGIGVILQLKDGSISWFFENEINFSKTEKASDNILNARTNQVINSFNSSSIQKKKLSANKKELIPIPKKQKDIGHLLNPLNFIQWLSYSLKDVF